MQQLLIITPIFNEKKTLPVFFEKFNEFKKQIANYKISWLIVDDGSKDKSISIAQGLVRNNKDIEAVILSRNFGKEAALFAGLEMANADLVLPMDVDLQDPFEVIPLMIMEYEKGYDVVLGKRSDRSSDSFAKSWSAKMFYKMNNRMSSLKLEENVGDFRLMTKQVVDEIVKLEENQLFMKGLMSWVGFDTAVVNYTRAERSEGTTKFNFFKLWNLALQGITSFSTIPLKIWSYFGGIIAMISFIYGLKIIVEKLFFGIQASGYASLMVAILFFGGVQLIGIGVLGEYLGRTYLETKKRPKYIIKKQFKNDKE